MFCSKCGKEIEDEAVICPGCGCQTPNCKKNTASSVESQNNPLNQSSNVSVLKLREYVETVNSAYIFSIIGLVLFAGIGIIFTILAILKIKNLPTISKIPSDVNSAADFESAKRKLATTRKIITAALILLALSVIGGIFGYIMWWFFA